jgi:hypothetical protein
MTIAIGAYCNDGVAICADTKVVWDDNSTSYGPKIFARKNGFTLRSFAVTSASRDGNAANGLARDILNVLHPYNDEPPDYEWKIKDVMSPWYANYGQVTPPHVELLVAASWPRECALFYCQPPQSVTRISIAEPPKAIGYGARAVEPFLAPNRYEIFTAPRCVLIRLAYLMYRAKKDEAAMCGGSTDCFVLYRNGGLIQIPQIEMERAESLGMAIDGMFDNAFSSLVVTANEELQKRQAAIVADKYLQAAKQAANVDFQSLLTYGRL